MPDFDAVLTRLAEQGVPTITAPVVTDGLRRVCFRDPWVGCVVEVMEEGAATPGGIRPRFYDLVPALVYATLSVPDLGLARGFFCATLGLVEEPGTVAPRAGRTRRCGASKGRGASRSSPAAATSTSRSSATTTRPVGRSPTGTCSPTRGS